MARSIGARVGHRQGGVAGRGDHGGGRARRVVPRRAGHEGAEAGGRAERQRERRRDGAAGRRRHVGAVGRAAAVGVIEARAGEAGTRDVRLVAGRGRPDVRRVPPLHEELVQVGQAATGLDRQPLLVDRDLLRLRDRTAAVGGLNLLGRLVEVVLAQDLTQRDVGTAGARVRLAAEQVRVRRLRRRDVPVVRAGAVVGRVEAVDQAVVERRVTRGRADAAGGVRRRARGVVALGQVRVALLEEGPLVLVLGDVVAPPLVHVLVVQRVQTDASRPGR